MNTLEFKYMGRNDFKKIEWKYFELRYKIFMRPILNSEDWVSFKYPKMIKIGNWRKWRRKYVIFQRLMIGKWRMIPKIWIYIIAAIALRKGQHGQPSISKQRFVKRFFCEWQTIFHYISRRFILFLTIS